MMHTYISILRGINITGHRIIKMEALRAMYAKLGYTAIQTYIQSGNVIFRCEKASPHEIGMEISEAIESNFGFDVPVIVLDRDELSQIISDNPYVKEESKDSSKVHVTFLSDFPDKEKFKLIPEGDYQGDQLYLVDRAIYVYCPNGYGNTKLNTNFFESKLKVKATCRNWKTTLELLRIAEMTVENDD